jgi:uncharacterized protein with HEPN domain
MHWSLLKQVKVTERHKTGGFRNPIARDFFGLDGEEVWDNTKNKILELNRFLRTGGTSLYEEEVCQPSRE